MNDGPSDNPQVSVVVPVGRIDSPLRGQLAALVAQLGAPPFEVILANNASGDDDAALLDEIVAGLDPSGGTFVVVGATEFRNASYARNIGVANARADMLAFCDADDRVHPDWLGRLTARLDGHAAVGGRLIDMTTSGGPARRPPATPDMLPTFMGFPYAVGANVLVTREAFDRAGRWDTSLHRCEDIALSWRLLTLGYTIGWADDACVDYHHRDGLGAMVRQHVAYGRGMAQVLARYELPGEAKDDTPGFERGTRLGVREMLRPNSRIAADVTPIGLVRRSALGFGRLVGTIEERLRATSLPDDESGS